MTTRAPQPTKDRRDIGQVTFLMDKVQAAREFSSCCVGIEAALEQGAGLDKAIKTASLRRFWSRD